MIDGDDESLRWKTSLPTSASTTHAAIEFHACLVSLMIVSVLFLQPHVLYTLSCLTTAATHSLGCSFHLPFLLVLTATR